MSDNSVGSEIWTESPITVLFVDEDEDFLDLASRLLELETEQIDLLPESSPQAALDRLRELDIDCVVSDYKMTEMDGLEFLDQVRSTHPRVPFILFTGKGGEEIASDAIAAGATDYIVKTGSPDQYTVLANRIEKAVSRARAEARTTQQEHFDAIIQTFTNEVIHQPTRDQIEHTICEQLVEIDPYVFVQISRLTAEKPSIRPQTWAVADAMEVDPEAITDVVGSDEQSPERIAYQTGETVCIEDLDDVSRFEHWHSSITDSQVASVFCLPITYGDISYGVLSIYATVPGIFSGFTATILDRFGEFIGFAISNAQQRQGMVSTTMIEVELTVRDASADLVQLAQTLGTHVTVESIVPRSDGRYSVSLVIDGDLECDQMQEAITSVLPTDDTTVSTTEDGSTRWAVVMNTCPIDRFENRGIRIKQITATEESGQIVLTIPPDIDIQTVVEIAESQFEDVELTKRREQTEQQQDVSTAAGIAEELTPRQREVFETAYLHGFFEWPREMNTEEIASLLDMSQPALSRHLRNIQRTIADHVIDSTDSTALE